MTTKEAIVKYNELTENNFNQNQLSVVIDGKYKGQLCSWTVQGYDPNFK